MKHPDRKTVARLEALPNIGPAIAGDLRLIGIDHPKQLVGKDPFDLYRELCEKTGIRHDPCVIDVFMAAVDFMEGGEPLPWWEFTAVRKDRLKAARPPSRLGVTTEGGKTEGENDKTIGFHRYRCCCRRD